MILNDKNKIKIADEKQIVGMCHGCFDVLHIGHIAHLKEAKNHCDVLIVSVTADEYINKGPNRPYYNQDTRMEMLDELECVDYVILSDAATPFQLIEIIKPNLYFKGNEYQQVENDLTGNIGVDIELVERNGGKVCFTTGRTDSSTRIINNVLNNSETGVKEYMQKLHDKYSLEYVMKQIDNLKNIKAVVIGEWINDVYVEVEPTGLMHKDPAVSSIYKGKVEHDGGAVIIANHIREFCKCDLITQGNPIVKKRYISHVGGRNRPVKLFGVNEYPKEVKINLPDLAGYDLTVVADFGHGFIDGNRRVQIDEMSGYIALMCQTNSDNYGKNAITKWEKCNMFAIDKREVDVTNHGINSIGSIMRVSIMFNTEGANGATVRTRNEMHKLPALTKDVIDTTGCGDAFFAMASICSFADIEPDITLLLASISATLHSKVLGNERCVKKSDVLQCLKGMWL